jgi:uncharacterized protein (TIGR03435 family)
MVRSLLADRFHLQVHTVTAEAAVFALIPARPRTTTGPGCALTLKGQPCSVHSAALNSGIYDIGAFPSACEELLAVPGDHGAVLVAGRNVTLQQIASFISSLGILTRPVVDQTALSGRFDFRIQFTPERNGPAQVQSAIPDDLPATNLQEAVNEQLGLKLKPTMAPVDTLIVDRAERPVEN